ncbi:unnamed protein product [Orchesella dallaii]|uniref:Spaetzle domain-containing protein n=1 Tax=Orchesella dallaii TaxID=48710 RepID=A0ABP1Q305_9HEXA
MRCLRLGGSNKMRQHDHYEHTMLEKRLPAPSHIYDIRKRVEVNGVVTLASEYNRHRNYYFGVNGDSLESCCPVVFEVIAPIYGRSRSGHMVELYKDENVQQKFYEYRCHKDYLEQPCRYVDNQHRKISKCVQQYLDTYALVKSDTSLTGWSMEHIRIASGCACKVDRVKASRRRKKVSSSFNFQRKSNNKILHKHSNGDSAGSKTRRNYEQFTSSTRIH